LSEHARVYVDKTAKLKLEQLNLRQFYAIDKIKWDGKFKRGQYHYWLFFELQNTNESDTLQFYFHSEIEDSIDVFKFKDNRIISHTQAGKKVFPTGDVPANLRVQSNDFIPIQLLPNERYSYFVLLRQRLGVEGGIQPLLYPVEHIPNSKWQPLSIYYLWQGLFFGILFFAFSFAILQFAQNRDRTFLYYALYALSNILFYIRLLWINDILLKSWTFHPLTLYEFAVPFGLGIYLFYFLFVSSFLNSREEYPWLYRFVKISVWVMLVFAFIQQIIVRVDIILAWQVTYYYRIVFGLVVLFFLVRLWFIKGRLARIIVIGTSFLTLISFFNTFYSLFSSNHWYKWWDFTQLGLQVGIVIELLFFYAGLGYRTKLMLEEKNKTELNLQAQKLENKNLQELEQFKTKLYTNLTHEFRTPLTLIKGLSEELRGQRRSKQNDQKLRIIRENSLQILDLVNQMLELSKLESGKYTVHFEQMDIILFLKYLTDSFQSLAHHKKIMLGFYSMLKECWMDIDKEKYQRIVSNLLSNALKFTEEYGQVKVSANREEQHILIKISDTGPGIAASDLPHVFDRFYQAKKDDYQGTGIGLSLVQELVHILEGSIEVESEAGRGTTFLLRFPIRQQGVKKRGNPKLIEVSISERNRFLTSSFETADKAKVLLIEDNQDIQDYLIRLLAPLYHIETAKNGVEGVKKAQSWSPQLILCDIMMPKMNGYEVCETLKINKVTASIPFILLTAKAAQSDKLEGLKYGADAYLKKPFDQEELLLTINNLLNRQTTLTSPFQQTGGDFTQRFKAVVKTHLSNEHLNIALLCQQLKVSKAQLNRQVKKEVECTPMQYVRQLRLQEAHYRLHTTDSSVKEVAFECGFPSVSAFSQAFKETFGINASEIKNK